MVTLANISNIIIKKAERSNLFSSFSQGHNLAIVGALPYEMLYLFIFLELTFLGFNNSFSTIVFGIDKFASQKVY